MRRSSSALRCSPPVSTNPATCGKFSERILQILLDLGIADDRLHVSHRGLKRVERLDRFIGHVIESIVRTVKRLPDLHCQLVHATPSGGDRLPRFADRFKGLRHLVLHLKQTRRHNSVIDRFFDRAVRFIQDVRIVTPRLLQLGRRPLDEFNLGISRDEITAADLGNVAMRQALAKFLLHLEGHQNTPLRSQFDIRDTSDANAVTDHVGIEADTLC